VGLDALPQPKGRSIWAIAKTQVAAFVSLLLLAAAGLGYALGEPLQAAALLATLAINALAGFVMDNRAETVIQVSKGLPTGIPPGAGR